MENGNKMSVVKIEKWNICTVWNFFEIENWNKEILLGGLYQCTYMFQAINMCECLNCKPINAKINVR